MEATSYSRYAQSYRANTNTRKDTHRTDLGKLTLYWSYGTVIACIDGDDGYMTARRYSVTTSKHQGYAAGDIYDETGQYATTMEDKEFRTALQDSLQRHELDTSPAYSGWTW
jgi:hypothetical protein